MLHSEESTLFDEQSSVILSNLISGVRRQMHGTVGLSVEKRLDQNSRYYLLVTRFTRGGSPKILCRITFDMARKGTLHVEVTADQVYGSYQHMLDEVVQTPNTGK